MADEFGTDSSHGGVETILEKRVLDILPNLNRTEYLVKRIDANGVYTTDWETTDAVGRPGLIALFERDWWGAKYSQSSEVDDTREAKEELQPKLVTGFARGLEPEVIEGAPVVDDTVMFTVKWVGAAETDNINARETNEKYPWLVQSFFDYIDDVKRHLNYEEGYE